VRAPFDTLADLFNGPGAALPGQLRLTVSCRRVLSSRITLQLAGFGNRVGWFTTASLGVRGPVFVASAPTYQFDFSLADSVVFASDPASVWTVLGREVVQPFGSLVYQRYWFGGRPG